LLVELGANVDQRGGFFGATAFLGDGWGQIWTRRDA
jgi:hypothetical protein